MIFLSSEDINALVYDYLHLNYPHSAWVFSLECKLVGGSLCYTLQDVLKRGMELMYLEMHVNKSCENVFMLGTEHTCESSTVEMQASELGVRAGGAALAEWRGDSLYVGCANSTVYRVEMVEGEEKAGRGVKPPKKGVFGGESQVDVGKEVTAIVHNGRNIVVGCYGGEVFFLDEELNFVKEHRFHSGPVFSLKARDERVVSGSYDGKICVFGDTNVLIPVHASSVFDVEWITESLVATCSSDKSVGITDIVAERSEILKGHKNEVNCIKYKNGILASCSDDCTVILWSPLEKKKRRILSEHTKRVLSEEWIGARLGTVSSDNTLKLWDIEKGLSIKTGYHDKSVYTVAYNENTAIIATGSLDKRVHLWDERCGQIGKYDIKSPVYEVKFNPIGNKLSVCASDRPPLVLDLRMNRD